MMSGSVKLARVLSACLKQPCSRLSTSSSGFMRRPLDLDDDHIETVEVKKFRQVDLEQERGSDERTGYVPVHEYDGPVERSLNQVTLLGRVGADPQIRGSEEKPVTAFRLATNSSWRTINQRAGEPEWSQRTEWHNCVVFKPGLRESSFNNIVKGARLHVTGRLMYGEFLDKNGVQRQTTSIVCDDIIYLTKKSSDS